MHVSSEEIAFSLQLTQTLSPVYSVMVEFEKREAFLYGSYTCLLSCARNMLRNSFSTHFFCCPRDIDIVLIYLFLLVVVLP